MSTSARVSGGGGCGEGTSIDGGSGFSPPAPTLVKLRRVGGRSRASTPGAMPPAAMRHCPVPPSVAKSCRANSTAPPDDLDDYLLDVGSRVPNRSTTHEDPSSSELPHGSPPMPAER